MQKYKPTWYLPWTQCQNNLPVANSTYRNHSSYYTLACFPSNTLTCTQTHTHCIEKHSKSQHQHHKKYRPKQVITSPMSGNTGLLCSASRHSQAFLVWQNDTPSHFTRTSNGLLKETFVSPPIWAFISFQLFPVTFYCVAYCLFSLSQSQHPFTLPL